MKVDLVVLGGGPGGYAAAFRAADLGIQTALVEARSQLGGVCLMEGCIPSKALLHATQSLPLIASMAEWGLRCGEPQIDLDTLRGRGDECVSKLAKGLAGLARSRKVRVIEARGVLQGPRRLHLEGQGLEDDRVDFDHLILCTGSEPVVPDALRADSDRLMTSREALRLPEVPGTLLVVGGGYIGLEMATVYARLGSTVTVVEMLDGLMPGVDADLVKPVRQRLDGLLETVQTGTEVQRITPVEDGLEVTFAREGQTQPQRFERVLVAVGRRPVTQGLGLENTDVELDDRGAVVVDNRQRTADEHILAAGDVTGEPLLAHQAFHEGHVAAEVLAGEPAAYDRRAVPAVLFTDPEVAWAGLGEQQARDAGIEVDVARYPWSASGRAHAIGRTDGLTKLIFEKPSARLLGAGIVGLEAGEMIAECVLAIEMGCRDVDLAATIHPHPTLSETIAGAAEVHLGLATEVRSKR